MERKPIQIPDDIAARYDDQPDQFKAFDDAFKQVATVPAHAVNGIKPPPQPSKSKGKKRG